jgi:hypothetical protein
MNSSSSSLAAAPHPHRELRVPQPAEFLITSAKRLLQHNRSQADIDVHITSKLLPISDIRRLSPHKKMPPDRRGAKLHTREKNVQVDVSTKRQNE